MLGDAGAAGVARAVHGGAGEEDPVAGGEIRGGVGGGAVDGGARDARDAGEHGDVPVLVLQRAVSGVSPGVHAAGELEAGIVEAGSGRARGPKSSESPTL